MSVKTKNKFSSKIILLAVASSCLSLHLNAQSYWNGGNGTWDSNNWTVTPNQGHAFINSGNVTVTNYSNSSGWPDTITITGSVSSLLVGSGADFYIADSIIVNDSGSFYLSNGGSFTFGEQIELNNGAYFEIGTGAGQLNLWNPGNHYATVTGGSSATYSSVIFSHSESNYTFGYYMTGNLNVYFESGGTTTITKNAATSGGPGNDYAGTTNIENATVIIDNDGSIQAFGSGQITILDNAMLRGNGFTGSAAMSIENSVLAPGSDTEIGKITVNGNVSIFDSATVKFKLGASDYDQVILMGSNLSLENGIIIDVNILDGFVAQENAKFNLFSLDTGTISGDFDISDLNNWSLVTDDGSYEWDWNMDDFMTDGSITMINVRAIPEPSMYASIAGLILLGGIAVKRRRK